MIKSVLVTGSSRGIGKAIALMLADVGYEVVLHCRSQREQAEKVRDAIRGAGGNARVLQFDVTDREGCCQILKADIEANGAYYGVICNAGITRDNAFPAMTGHEWDSVIHTNLDSFYNVLQPVIMPMIHRRKPGRIIVLSSVSGIVGNRGQTNYSATKAGLIAASKSLALELAKRKITVNCIAPGIIETDMTEGVEDFNVSKLVPIRRMGKPEEVASAVKFLISEEAAYITRQVLAVDGGLS